MWLDATTKSLELILAGAVATTQLPFTVDYGEVASDNSTSAPKAADGQSNGATAVTLVGAPAAGLVREVMHLSVHNADTAAATVTIRLNNGGTFRTVKRITLQAGEGLHYDTSAGWFVTDANGVVKGTGVSYAVGANPSATVGLSAVNGSASTFMRSDGAPPLSQAVAPTWTGLHTFTAGIVCQGPAGAVLLTVKGAPSQSLPLQEWRKSDNTLVASIQAPDLATVLVVNSTSVAGTYLQFQNSGVMQFALGYEFGIGFTVTNSAGTAGIFTATAAAVCAPNGNQFAWSSTTGSEGALDTGLKRSSAGVVKVTNGGSGIGDLLLRTPFIRRNAAPADAELVAGDVALWLDSTNGACKLMIKAKQADGTVVVGSLPLV